MSATLISRRERMRFRRSFGRWPHAAALAMSTLAADRVEAEGGVLEINQTCATRTGCFAGDDPGFPVTIDGAAARSYRLSGDLTLTSEGMSGIWVMASDVSLDLGGFSIRGVATCAGVPAVCSASPLFGSGVWVHVTGARARVQNGSVSGMGVSGILVEAPGCVVKDVRVSGNAKSGIDAATGTGCTVSGVTALENGLMGIDLGSASVATGNVARGNGGHGIRSVQSSLIAGNTTYGNGVQGIQTSDGCTIRDNVSGLNGDDGISASIGSTISGNTAYANAGDGISVVGGLVVGNSIRDNTQFGLRLSGGSAYRENLITSNTAGTVFTPPAGSFFNLGDNACMNDAGLPVPCP